MKVLIISIIIILTLSVRAQEKQETPNFPNWVIESNVKTPRNSVIKFYNAKQDLVYAEAINGKKIRIKRAKIRNGLNLILQQIVDNKATQTSTDRVKTFLKIKQGKWPSLK